MLSIDRELGVPILTDLEFMPELAAHTTGSERKFVRCQKTHPQNVAVWCHLDNDE